MLPSGRRTRRFLHEQGHSAEALNDGGYSHLAYFTFSLCNTLWSTSMTSMYGLSAGTVGTSALWAVPWLHEHSERLAVEAKGS